MKLRAALCLSAVAAVFSACAPSITVPGNSYTRANSSLAVQSWEASAVLALVSVPGCERHRLVNTDVVSVEEPLRLEGTRATEGAWVEKWTYDICGTTVAVRMEYDVDERGTRYAASVW